MKIEDKDRYKKVYTNEEGYTFYIDKPYTNYANRMEIDSPYLVYLVKSDNINVTRLLVNNKEREVLAELPLDDNYHQLCAKIDVIKVWSKKEKEE